MAENAHPVCRKSWDVDRLRVRLEDLIGARVSDAHALRTQHSRDEAWHEGLPDLVVLPKSIDEIAAVMRCASDEGAPVVPWGAGTSLEGGALAISGGICLDLSLMDEVLEVCAEDLLVRIQAGVRREQLNAMLKGTGLYFPIDPGADATLGGMVATRASGTTAVRYGTMRDNVLGLTAVLPTGQVIRTGGKAPKSAAGYDLTGLLVGSEGTLAVIAEITLRLHPLPEAVETVVCNFPDLGSATDLVCVAVQLGMDFARVEFLDAGMMRAINSYLRAAYQPLPTLFVEFHGSPAHTTDQADRFEQLLLDFGGSVSGRAKLPEERSELWKARHAALYAARSTRAGSVLLITDVCVPISQLSRCVAETMRDMEVEGLIGTVAGHVGDGNFHVFLPFDPSSEDQRMRAEALHARMGHRAIALGGTCTGEHGIGIGKRNLLEAEAGEGVGLMVSIKQAIDPRNLMNPGKLFNEP